MKKISTSLPDELVEDVDRAARSLEQSRSEILRNALQAFLAELDSASESSLAVPNPDLLLLDWNEVEHTLLSTD